MPNKAERFVSVFQSIESDRKLVEPLWRDVSYLVMPSRSTEESRQRGRDRSGRTYDNTANVAATRLASLMAGSLTSPALEWFILQPIDPAVKDREADLWMEQAQQILLSVFRSPSSGFNSAMSEAYMDLAGFGTCAVFSSDDDVIRFNALPMDEVYVAQNHHGRIDTMYRKKFWSADQAAGFFGLRNLSDAQQAKFDSPQRYTDTCEYLHVVLPREDADVEKMNMSTNKAFASMYIDRESCHVVSEGGFDQFPYAVARWKVSSGEIYGTSPAIDVIDEIRLVNAMKKTIITASEKAADPPLQVSDDSVIGKLRAMASGITYMRPGTEIKQLPVGDPRISVDQLAESRAFIQQAFFSDIAQLPLQDRMTATEVVERRNDKLQVLSPYVSRVQEELLSPIIGRTLALLVKNRVLPNPPRSLQGSGIRVEYVSPLAVSQRTSRVQAVQVWINSLLPLVQIDPSIMISIKTESLPGYVAEALNVPPQLIRDEQEVEQIRQQQQQNEALRSAAETGNQIAEAAKTAAEADSIAGRIGAI